MPRGDERPRGQSSGRFGRRLTWKRPVLEFQIQSYFISKAISTRDKYISLAGARSPLPTGDGQGEGICTHPLKELAHGCSVVQKISHGKDPGNHLGRGVGQDRGCLRSGLAMPAHATVYELSGLKGIKRLQCLQRRVSTYGVSDRRGVNWRDCRSKGIEGLEDVGVGWFQHEIQLPAFSQGIHKTVIC